MPKPCRFSSATSLLARIGLRPLLAASVASLALWQTAFADVRLPHIFNDGMVLQRDQPLAIYGWADEGEQVSVVFAGHSADTTAKEGRWQVTLPAVAAGGPFTLEVSGNNRLVRENILTGDVWIAAGQSNMELPLRRVAPRFPGLIESTRLPAIREFSLPLSFSTQGPQTDYTAGSWKTAEPENLAGFSASGFFFARALHQQTGVAIGIISIAVGGSPAEAWVSEQTLQGWPHYEDQLKPFRDLRYLEKVRTRDKANSDHWYSTLNAADTGLQQQWFQPSLDDKEWSTLTIPGWFRQQNIAFERGSVWLRKQISLNAEQAAKTATLWMGTLVDGDEIYVNGTVIGQTGYQYPPRIYALPAGLLKAGDNTISIRLTSYTGQPGFTEGKRYALDLGNESVPLDGEWRYRVAATADAQTPGTTLHYLPSTLFNARIAPLLPMSVKGVIWYQGESNIDRPKRIPEDAPIRVATTEGFSVPETGEYHALFTALINDWRHRFEREDLPFIFAQLPNFHKPATEPGESRWAELREAQRQTLKLPHTAMAVLIDVGEWNDLHPLDKQSVGERLALGARKVAYGETSLLASGPVLKSLQRKGNRLILEFEKTGKGLRIKGKSLAGFALAGDDGKFVYADARLNNNRITLTANNVKTPVQVRYAWADNPATANLYNSAGLPASPFHAVVSP